MTSIRRDLLLWLLSSVLAGGLAASAVVFFQARAEANELFDYQLRQLALTLRDRTYSPRQLADVLQGEEALDFKIQVWAPDGTPLYESQRDVSVPGAVQLGLSDVDAPTGQWRVFAIQQRGLTIQVAQAAAVRRQLAFRAAARTLTPFLLALPLMGLLIWRLVGRALAPLEATARAVAVRTPESLQPIGVRGVPVEIRPLVEALDDLLSRLGTALARQRDFIADAAHELRTPLTALRLQLQLAERSSLEDERREAHAALRAGILRATRLVEQLLALARQDPDVALEKREAVDLRSLAESAAAAHRANAAAAGLELTLDAERVEVNADRAALAALLDNVLDNAIRYTPAGRVSLRVRRSGSEAIIEVEDTGPGIDPRERQRVFDRFYRGESGVGGSGLGLAIARRIVERHAGRIELADAAGDHGLLVRIALPLAP